MFSHNSQTLLIADRPNSDMDSPLSNDESARSPPPQSNLEFSKIFRDMFSRALKRRHEPIEKEMTTLSIPSIQEHEISDTSTSKTNGNHTGNICLFSDSPHYIVRVSKDFPTEIFFQ